MEGPVTLEASLTAKRNIAALLEARGALKSWSRLNTIGAITHSIVI